MPSFRSLAPLAFCTLFSCGSSSKGVTSTNTVSSLSAAAPLIALASPVASRSGQAASSKSLTRLRDATSSGTASAMSLPDQIAAIKTRLGQTTVNACLKGIQLVATEAQTSCFGPSLAYLNYPDSTTGYQSMTSGCAISTGNPGDGCLPSGDLGIWSATEPTGEACTSATMNAQVLSVSSVVNSAVTLMAGLICVAQVNGADLTAGAAALDLHDTINSNLGTALTTASLQRLADQSDGRATYRIAIIGTVNGTPLSVTAVHSPGDTTGNGAAGLISGYLDNTDSMMQEQYRKAFSVLYGIASGSVTYELRSGGTSTDVPLSALFGADGTFDFAAQLARRDGSGMASGGTFERARIDGTTGLGTLVHAWQAGNADPYTRVFQATTSAGASGSADTGYGYFGFGPVLDSADLGSIVGMWCNWAGPGSQVGTANVNTTNVQAQTMTRDATSGLFIPVTTDITYAPTNDCNATASSGFVYEPFGPTGSPSMQDLQKLTPSDVTNDLVPLGTLGVIPDVPSPAPYAIPAS